MMCVLKSSFLFSLLVVGFSQQLCSSKAEFPNPPPRWRCHFDASLGTQWTIFDYYGAAHPSVADTLCAKLPLRTVSQQLITVNDLRNTCLQGFFAAQNPGNTYAVENGSRIHCYTPCNTTSQCLTSCRLIQPVLVICKVIYHVVKTAVLIDCGSFDNPAFGSVEFPNGHKFWSFLSYQCAKGYTLKDRRPVFCEHDGKWKSFSKTFGDSSVISAQPNMCQPLALCTAAKSIPNGLLYITNNSIHAVARAMCTEGFSFDGDPTARCRNDGSWSNPNGSCKAVCPSVQYIPNGLINITSSKVDATAQAICFQSFKFTGNPSVRCQTNGVWSSPTGSCDELCPAWKYVPNGFIQARSTRVNSTALVICRANHTLAGNGTVTCQEGGMWSAPTGTCEARIGDENPTSETTALLSNSTSVAIIVLVAALALLLCTALLVIVLLLRRGKISGSGGINSVEYETNRNYEETRVSNTVVDSRTSDQDAGSYDNVPSTRVPNRKSTDRVQPTSPLVADSNANDCQYSVIGMEEKRRNVTDADGENIAFMGDDCVPSGLDITPLGSVQPASAAAAFPPSKPDLYTMVNIKAKKDRRNDPALFANAAMQADIDELLDDPIFSTSTTK